jgi:alpha-beta hydrolase superfamily lysophospholipase
MRERDGMLTRREDAPSAYRPPTAAPSARGHHWFRSGDDWCAAIWQQGAGPVARVAILCPSIAQEHLRGQRHSRALARRLAARGVGSLRFDYPATGNSTGSAIGGDDDGPDLAARWTAGIRDAVAHVSALAPEAEIVLVARRFGALLAVRALGGLETPIASLVLWDPSLTGHAHLRELRMREAARLDVLFASELDRVEPGVALQTEGHRFGARAVETLTALTLDVPAPKVGAIHLIGEIGPRVQRVVARWRDEAGAAIATTHPTSDAAFDWANPEGSALPEETLEVVAGIVAADRRETSDDAGHAVVLPPADVSHRASDGALIRERLERFGEEDALFGVHSFPDSHTAVRTAVLVLGTGIEPSPGFGDAWARFARTAASRGAAVLRIDYRGNGESDARAGERENVSYLSGRVDDVRTGVAWLRARWPGVPIVVTGVCTGGFYGVHAAAAKVPMDRVIAINPQLWCSEQESASNSTPDQAVFVAQRSTAALQDASKWMRLLRGGYRWEDVALAVRGLAARAVGAMLAAGRSGGSLGGGLPRLDLERLFPPDAPIHLVFSQGDFGYEHLLAHGRRRVQRLLARPHMRLHLIEGVDHTFSREWMRRRLDEELLSLLGV